MNLVGNSPKAEVPTEYILVDFAHMHKIKGQGKENKLFGTKKMCLLTILVLLKTFSLLETNMEMWLGNKYSVLLYTES